MFPRVPSFSLPELKSAIIRTPLLVSPDTPVVDAIAQMGSVRSADVSLETSLYNAASITAEQLDNLHQRVQSGCVLVVENEQLVGIFTERDVIRLSAHPQSLPNLVMRQVMTSPVVSLHQDDFTDLLFANYFLQQHHIRYLPILDAQDHLVGLVNRESLLLAIATQQATAYQHLQIELAERQEADAKKQDQLAEMAQWRRRYELAEQASRQILYEYDFISDFIIWGANTQLILGYPASVLPIHLAGWLALIHPDDQAMFRLSHEQAIASKTPFFSQYRVQHQAGHYIWIEDRSQWLMNDRGELTGVVGKVTDISERKRSEEALQNSEAHQRALMAAIPDLIMRINRAGTYLEFVATPNFHVVGDIPEMVGTHVSDTLPLEVAQQRMEFMQLALQTNSIQIYQQDLSIEGRTQIEEVRIVPYSEDEVLVLVRDISERARLDAERKQAELALAASEAQCRAVLAAIPDLMFRVGADGVYRECITPCRELDLMPRTVNPVGLLMEDVMPVAHARQQFAYLQKALQTGELQVYEQQIQIGDRYRDEEVRVIKSGEDEVLFMIRDISDRKRTETILRSLIESTAAVTGKNFFSTLAQQLMLALKVQYVLITKLVGDRLETLAYWKDGEPQSEITFALADAPCCAKAIEQGQFYIAKGLQHCFVGYPLIQSLQADSYLGISLTGTSGQQLGNLCILDSKPMEDIQWANAFLRIFATRAAAELERQQATDALEQLNQELEARVAQRTADLCNSEAKLSAIFNQAAVGINLATPDGQYLKINQKLCDILGYTEEELLGKNFREISHPEDLCKGEAERQQLYAGAINFFAIEKRCLHKNGSTVWINLTVSLLRQPSGEPEYSIGIVEDISKRKQVEEALRQSEEKFRQLAENIRGVFWIGNATSNEILYVSSSYETIWGRSCESLYASPRSFIDAIHPEDQARVLVLLANQSRGYDTEYRVLRPDGTLRWVRDRAFPIYNAEGQVYRFAGIAEDITVRKQAEETLSRQLATIEASIDGIAILNSRGEYTYLNQAHVRLLGYDSAEELMGKTWRMLYSPAEVSRFETEVLPRLAETGAWRGDAIATRRDGSTFDQEVSLTLTTNGEVICICRNISERTQLEVERRQTEQALQQSEERFRTVFDHAPIAISLAKVNNYQIFRVNAAHRQLFGYSDAELATMSFADFTYPDDIEKNTEHVKQMVRGEISGFQMEKRFIRKNGDVILTNMTVALIRDRDGHPLYSMAMIEDITERKQSEMLLKTQQDFLRRLIDTVPNLIFVKDWESRFMLVNQATANTYQSTIEDLIGKTDADFNPNQAEIEQFVAADREVMTTMTTQVMEEIITSPDGKQRYFQTIKTPILFADGHSKGILGVATDISDRKHIEEQLRRKEAYLLEAQRIAHVGSWKFDLETQKITWSAETFRMFGYDPEQQEPTFEELMQSIHPDDRNYHQVIFQWAIEQLQPFELEHRVVKPDGCISHILAKGQPIVDETGKLLSFLGTVLDITSRKQAEAQLRQTNEQLTLMNMKLARATRLKDEFLANMSHELRTPLNAILGMTEGLQDQVFGSINDRQLKALQTIEQSGLHLLKLIDDILDIAKIEAGQMELHCIPTAVAPLCQSSLAFIKQQALKKRIQLKTQLPLNLPDLLVDERRIRQVLINLLNNAVKFTPDGGQITLQVNRQPYPTDPDATDSSYQNFLQITITDTGIGIAPDHFNKLFQPFIQIDSALNRKYQGTGLGLALVKRIVELHGGQVGVTSEVGVGSCFTIDLPCADTASAVEPEPQSRFIPEASQSVEASPVILLAEDNEANISTISCYLEAKGYRILLARNGQEAIAIAQSEKPDLILMDIQMPGMDGLEALQQIRRDSSLIDVPIVALTALAMAEDRERCLAAGAIDYLTKPVKLKQLATTIQQLLAPQANQ